jgi:hypothetical protein
VRGGPTNAVLLGREFGQHPAASLPSLVRRAVDTRKTAPPVRNIEGKHAGHAHCRPAIHLVELLRDGVGKRRELDKVGVTG